MYNFLQRMKIMRKLLYLIMLTIYISVNIGFCVNAIAENSETKKASVSENKETDEEKPQKYSPRSNLMLMVDMDSGLIMYEKNADEHFSPGSLAKILTAITALENCDNITKTVTIENGILENYDYDNGNIGLKYGENISIKNMIEAMLINDAGDCALAIAHSVGKSYDEFVAAMNETAEKAGAKSSRFINPAGFDEKGQKTTLRDMYYITEYALKNDIFAKIVDTERIEIGPTNKYDDSRILFNTNQFITTYYSLNHYNANMHGVKGYYNTSKDCGMIAKYKDLQNNLLILCAESEHENGNSYAYNDVEYMLNVAKENFTQVSLVGKEEFVSEIEMPNGKNAGRLLLISEDAIKAKLPVDYDKSKIERKTELENKILAPIKKGEVLGTISVYYNGEKCGESKLLAYSDIEKSTINHIKYRLSMIVGSGYFKAAVIILILIFIIRAVQLNRKKK